jgi:pyridinium-3,5-biscarboxylic acid mononucleotide synthase
MDPARLKQLLEKVQSGEMDLPTALAELRTLPFADLGYARVDHHRALRQGVPEVIFAEGKTVDQIVGIVEEILRVGHDVLVTRLGAEPARDVVARVPSLEYVPIARVAKFKKTAALRRNVGYVAVVSAGTSDMPVAEEAVETLTMCGVPVERVYDVGVAGLHRLTAELPRLGAAAAVVVVAGMEGALPSVVGGLVRCPVIAVPTSVGYGASLGGLTPLFGMLSSCASGVTVVNIDNGFGAAMAVVRLLGGPAGASEGP